MTHRNDVNCSVNVIITDSAFLWCFAAPTVGALGEASAKARPKALASLAGPALAIPLS